MFETKADRPQWAIIYDRLASMQIGETIKYDELTGLLPDATIETIRGAFYTAVRHIEDDMQRTFDNVRTVGYRMVDAPEHERLARSQHKKAKRRLKSAFRKARSADRSRLDPDQRRRLDAIEDHLGRQQDMIRRLDARVTAVETEVKSTKRQQKQDAAAVSERLDKLAALLERHGITDKQPAA